jgi:hypothetical protein
MRCPVVGRWYRGADSPGRGEADLPLEDMSDLPIEQPVKIDLVIHNGSARALGLALSAKLLAFADDVIE